MKPSELPGTRSLYRLTNRALAQIRELWQYAGEDELPPESLLQAQVEALRILHIDVPLSAKRQFQLFCSEHFPGLAETLPTVHPLPRILRFRRTTRSLAGQRGGRASWPRSRAGP